MRTTALASAFEVRLAVAVHLVLLAAVPVLAQPAGPLDLREATIVVSPVASEGEMVAAEVLREEVASRTGLSWAVSRTWPVGGPVVAVSLAGGANRASGKPAFAPGAEKPEAYRLLARRNGMRPVVWVTGADRRGTLFGVGGLLRALVWGRGTATLPELDVTASPRYPLRGHQLGYRQHSNTYDGWTAEHYDRYIRELALLGANAVENIPFQDARPSPLMPISRAAMARRISEICAKYDQQYWLWTPADFDLADAAKRTTALNTLDALFADLPRLDAIFLPGGDPGDNDATLVVPYLAEMSARLRARHPQARIWLSLQHFDAREIDFLFAWIDRERAAWLGGLVAGPGSYSLAQMRARLDRRYQVRDYPDVIIDHAKKRITIRIPPAKLIAVEVRDMHTYDERGGLWNPFTREDRDNIQRQARAQLMAAGGELALLRHANESAMALLRMLLAKDGYTVDVALRGV